LTVWPDGKQAAGLFSFDVDGESVWINIDQRNAQLPVTMSQAQYGPRVGVFEILRILRRHQVPATFFVPTATVQRYPDTLAAIVDEGHEVGLHG
jgi:peptidoglycan-N-acetylglucosamine deacetylase